MKVSIYTLGCKVNYAETAQLQSKFEELGYSVTEFGKPSDIILINTCSVTNNADIEARKIIRRAKRTNPESYLGVMGCYAQLKPNEVANIEGVDGVFGQKEKFLIPVLINNIVNDEKTQINVSCIEDLPFETAVTTDNESRTRAFLKLQDGCNYFCTFCTIPYARGRSRSISFSQIESQFRKVVESGYKEVIISGINLGDYKSPSGENFTDMVRLISELELDLRVRISSIEPNLLKDEIINIVADSPRFCKHFHIPLQSGSSEILKKMRRRYKADFYRDLIFKIKEKIPECGIGIDVIVGFPGESDSHFSETYDFLDLLPASYFHVFTYSERDNTPAANFDNPVPVNIRKERTNILRALSDKKKHDFYQNQIGNVLTVIPETYDYESNTWKGWSDNYVRVKFDGTDDIEKNFTKVKIIDNNSEFAIGKLSF